MERVATRLCIGNEIDCQVVGEEWAVLHACMSPCHQHAVGYRGVLASDHPEYLIAERMRALYLNIVESDDPPLHHEFGPMAEAALDFIDHHRQHRDVLVHSTNETMYAPALVLLYLAARTEELPTDSYEAAKGRFITRCSTFSPPPQLDAYLSERWRDLVG